MSATREHRNAGKLDDAIAAIGAAITTAENMREMLSGNLPDGSDGGADYEGEAMAHLANLRAAHDNATEALGI